MEKKGKKRWAMFCGTPKEEKLIVDLMTQASSTKVFSHIHSKADIHGYRAVYASKLYKRYARPIESLQGQLLDVQEQIATAKAQELLLEDKTNQVSELKKQIDLKNDEIENLKEQLSEEKSKGFFAKIFGRK